MIGLMGPSGADAPHADRHRDSGYAPTYYPGTPAPAEAQKITVAVGQEAQGIDFALVPVRLARITGIVPQLRRPARGGRDGDADAGAGERAGVMMLGGGARTDRDGASR